MAMTIAHNSSSALVLGELNRNSNRLSKDLKKVSSGMRLNSAGDSAAEYSISEKMRTMIRALGQDLDNSTKGIDLVRVAEGGIQSIINELRDMKAMALDSANAHNSDEDRAILQKVFASRMEEIDDIASITNYNGRILLDGTWHEPLTRTVAITTGGSGSSGTGGAGGSSGSGGTGGAGGTGGTSGSGGTGGTGSTGGTGTGLPARPVSSTATIIPSGNYTISTDGVYRLDTGYQGTVTITAQNVELQQTDSIVNDTYINCVGGHQNLWMNGIVIENRSAEMGRFVEKSIVKFTGTGNTLNLCGNNYLLNNSAKTKAIINVSDGLSINDGDGTGTLSCASAPDADSAMNNNFVAAGACIGSDEGENSSGYIVINGGAIYCGSDNYGPPWQFPPFDGGAYCAAIGSGKNASIGMISMNGGSVSALGRFGAAIGSGYNGTVNGDIVIRNGTVFAMSRANSNGTRRIIEHSAAAAIGAGENGSVNGNIIIKGGDIQAISQGQGAAIGAGGYDSNVGSVGNITIKNCTLHASSLCAEAIGHATYDDEDHMNLAMASRSTLSDYIDPTPMNPATGGNGAGGLGGSVGTIAVYGGNYSQPGRAYGRDFTEASTGSTANKSFPFYHVYDRDISDTTGATAPDGDPGDPPDSILQPGDPGEEPVPDDGGESGGTEPPPEEPGPTVTYETEWLPGNPLIIHTGPKANQHLRIYINDMHSDAMGLDDVVIDPLEKAREAMERLDTALEYALKENTRMGAYQIRLQETIGTLTARHENIMSAESVIRDADMAAEMMGFTKDRILSQASQAMLAQANTNSGAVLNLLR